MGLVKKFEIFHFLFRLKRPGKYVSRYLRKEKDVFGSSQS